MKRWVSQVPFYLDRCLRRPDASCSCYRDEPR